MWMNNWHRAQKISEIFRFFAAVMSKTPGIYFYVYDSVNVCTTLRSKMNARR